jgi:hypothetical protein
MGIKEIVFVGACAALAGCAAAPRQVGNADDVRAVADVVERFRVALLNKDKASYMRLFFSSDPRDIGWQAVLDDPSLSQVRARNPEAVKAARRAERSFVSLIDSVVASKTAEEETMSNVAVDTDGEVAAVAFDYSYLSDHRVTNWGREQWQLVRTEAGWKIFSVIYTVRLPKPAAAD